MARRSAKVDAGQGQRDHYGMGNIASSRLALALVLTLGFALALAIGSTYFGHASSPYGTCYGSSGRTIPCAVARAHGA